MAAFFGPSYRVDGALLAGLTLAAASLALLTLTGSAVLALGRHRAYATGWVVSTVAAAGLLTTGLPIADRAVLSLGVGPLVGIAVHLAAVRTATRDEAPRPATL
jgi:O-antigen/teichoic acid export membrane protein